MKYFFIIILVLVFVSGCNHNFPVFEETIELKEEIEENNVETTNLVKDKSTKQRVQEAYDNLHDVGSAQYIRDHFPDIELVYTDPGNPPIPEEIYPFRYYYSEEADKTFNLCNIERTVFICDGKLDEMVTDEDLDSGRCIVTPIYQLTPGHRSTN